MKPFTLEINPHWCGASSKRFRRKSAEEESESTSACSQCSHLMNVKPVTNHSNNRWG